MSKSKFAARFALPCLSALLLAGLLSLFLASSNTALAGAPSPTTQRPMLRGQNLPTGNPFSAANPGVPPLAVAPVPDAAAPTPTPDAASNVAPGATATPDATAAAAVPAPSPMEPDKISLADVRDKLTVTRDETWVLRDRMLSMDLMKAYTNQASQLNGIQ